MHFYKFIFLTTLFLALCACGSGSSNQNPTSPVATIYTDENETTLHLYATSNQADQPNDFTYLESFSLGYGGMKFLIDQGSVPDWQQNVPQDCKSNASLGIDKLAQCVFMPLLAQMNSSYNWDKSSIAVTAVFTVNDTAELQKDVTPLAQAADDHIDSAGYDAQIYYDPLLPELNAGTQQSSGHFHAAYSHESAAGAYYPDWMARLDKNLKLNALSIPGTHDSMSLHGGDMAATQTMNLSEQLKAGIRALDIRCRHFQNACSIHHGRVFQQANLDDVLITAKNFLAAHPNEFIIMRVKDECDPKAPCIENSRSWNETFKSYYDRYGSLFWHPTNAQDTNPNVDGMRGKIVVLQDWDKAWNFGIPLGYPRFDVQDRWEISTEPQPYHEKWELVRQHLDSAMAQAVSDTSYTWVTFINAASYYNGVLGFPYFFASGKSTNGTSAPLRLTGKTTATRGKDYCPSFPRVSCAGKLCSIAYLGMNILTSNKLAGGDKKTRIGIIYADFPGHLLIEDIIVRNP